MLVPSPVPQPTRDLPIARIRTCRKRTLTHLETSVQHRACKTGLEGQLALPFSPMVLSAGLSVFNRQILVVFVDGATHLFRRVPTQQTHLVMMAYRPRPDHRLNSSKRPRRLRVPQVPRRVLPPTAPHSQLTTTERKLVLRMRCHTSLLDLQRSPTPLSNRSLNGTMKRLRATLHNDRSRKPRPIDDHRGVIFMSPWWTFPRQTHLCLNQKYRTLCRTAVCSVTQRRPTASG